MIYATGITVCDGCTYTNCQEIDEIRIKRKKLDGTVENLGFFPKADLYDFLEEHPDKIKVGIKPFPLLKPARSSNDKKYVRSKANDTPYDNLLELPEYVRRIRDGKVVYVPIT